MHDFAAANWGWFLLATGILGLVAAALGSNAWGRKVNAHVGEATDSMLLAFPMTLLFVLFLIATIFMVLIGIRPN